jgi:TonB family protein
MKHPLSNIVVTITFLLLIAVGNSASAKINIQKAVKVLNGKIMAADFDLSTIDYKTVVSVKQIDPDPKIMSDLIAKFGKDAKYGMMIINTKVLSKEDSIKLASEPEKIYQVIEQIPEFPGGDEKLLTFIRKNIKFPNEVHGRVIVRFVITSKGKIIKAMIAQSLDPECDKEALRVVSLITDFIPGKQNGINVPVWYVLPISFNP